MLARAISGQGCPKACQVTKMAIVNSTNDTAIMTRRSYVMAVPRDRRFQPTIIPRGAEAEKVRTPSAGHAYKVSRRVSNVARDFLTSSR